MSIVCPPIPLSEQEIKAGAKPIDNLAVGEIYGFRMSNPAYNCAIHWSVNEVVSEKEVRSDIGMVTPISWYTHYCELKDSSKYAFRESCVEYKALPWTYWNSKSPH